MSVIKRIGALAALLALPLLDACGGGDRKETGSVGGPAMSGGTAVAVDPARDLEALRGARILFGHQSVGRNILDGVKSLADRHAVALRLEEAAPGPRRPGIENIRVGRNTDPASKCSDFLRYLEQAGDGYDIVIMKFCYVDLDDGTDVAALFKAYTEYADRAKALSPSAVLVHATVPLLTGGTGWKVAVKRLLGRDPSGIANMRRNEFNALLLEKYAGEPVFDIARAESTLPDGGRASFRHGGRTFYTMAPEYTYDGGHLNDEGKSRLASEFARVLAAALRSKGS